jgi:DNA-binding beta-propeller fold protein YncE
VSVIDGASNTVEETISTLHGGNPINAVLALGVDTVRNQIDAIPRLGNPGLVVIDGAKGSTEVTFVPSGTIGGTLALDQATGTVFTAGAGRGSRSRDVHDPITNNPLVT